MHAALICERFTPETDAVSENDAGATVLDASWTATNCLPGDGHPNGCVATIRRTHDGSGVYWVPQQYDIGNLKGAPSTTRQLLIDQWASRLARTLVTYDAELFATANIHASFYLVGHSMGGELVVRALHATLADSSLKAAFGGEHRGLLRAVIAVDGALNWQALGFGFFPSSTKHCDSRVYTIANGSKETANATAVIDASKNLGVTTVSVTNAKDWIVPPSVATLTRPKLASVGYHQYLFYGFGVATGWPGDPNCGHSTLLRRHAVEWVIGLAWNPQFGSRADPPRCLARRHGRSYAA